MAVKHLGKIPVVCLNAWDVADGEEPGPASKHRATRGVRFTVVDPNTGKTGEAEGPWFGTPESREFWKPVFDGIAKILKARGMENSMMHGVCRDVLPSVVYMPPSRQAWDDLDAVAPGVKWVMQSGKDLHGSLFGKTPKEFLGCYSHSHSPNQVEFFVPDLTREKRLYGWQALYRTGYTGGVGKHNSNPSHWRALLERHLVSGRLGIARLGFDFFDLAPEKLQRDGGSSSGGRTLCNRYPENDRGMQNINFDADATRFVNAGKDGPLGTVRLEMLREGAQECEARIFIEKALVDPELSAKMGKDLVKRAQDLLDRRQVYLAALQSTAFHARDTVSDQRQLFAMAAEVQAKLR
jgi:hypothetical protein